MKRFHMTRGSTGRDLAMAEERHKVLFCAGIPDPAAVEGAHVASATVFRQACSALETRIKPFLRHPIASIGRISLHERMDAVGATPPEPPSR